jgi:hypothetical protein
MMYSTLSARIPSEQTLRLANGPIGRAGGVALFDGLPDRDTCTQLLREALSVYGGSSRQIVLTGDNAPGRGGCPPRALNTAGGGPAQDELYAAAWLRAFLSQQCGVHVTPTGTRGSYSYYVAPGDYLGLHLDIDSCDVTLISVLRDDAGPEDPAGGLLVHLSAFGATLFDARQSSGQGSALVKAQAGQSVVLLGGLLPHETIPLGGSGQRIISALCFRAS